MADALLSPTVGIAMWVASGAVLARCSSRVSQADQGQLVPLMGVLGAFVFAAQMINFTIPGTGSSGHIGGGLLLSILAGPYAAFVVIASVLTVQALFFADGGLLALGANIFNLGLFPCFVGYLLVYKPLMGANPLAKSKRTLTLVTVLAAVIGLQLGALGVVMETLCSGISNLSSVSFLLLMQPIHLAIGIVEGLATAAIVLSLSRARPDLFIVATRADANPLAATRSTLKPLLLAFVAASAITAGALSWFASTQPDGLEWSVARAGASVEQIATAESGFHKVLAQAQLKTAWLADYQFSFWSATATTAQVSSTKQTLGDPVWPAVNSRGSLAGLIGAATTLALVLMVGYGLRRKRRLP